MAALIICFVVGFFIVQKVLNLGKKKPSARFNDKAADPAAPAWYDVLGVDRHSSLETIRQAYIDQIQSCHPDRVANMSAEFQRLAESKTKEVNAAYATAKYVKRNDP